MDQIQQEQLEQQRNTWNQYSKGWKKWDEVLVTMMRPVSNGLIDSLHLKGTEHVLDVASGTGEPGLTISSFLPNGQVTGIDLSENMVGIANEHATQRGISNYRCQACDASNMPFEDKAFDHVISRFGIMFFPDLAGSIKEMARTLKPGGKMSLIVWGAPQLNPFIALMAMTIMEKLEIPKPPPDAPGPFRCAQPGLTKQLLIQAGLENSSESNIKGEAIFDSKQQYWDVFSDVGGPVMQALNNAEPEVIQDVKDTVLNKAENFVRDGKMSASWEAIIATGVKQ